MIGTPWYLREVRYRPPHTGLRLLGAASLVILANALTIWWILGI